MSDLDKLIEENKRLRLTCVLTLNAFYCGSDGYWKAGPLADPNMPEGKGGLIEMLQEACKEEDEE